MGSNVSTSVQPLSLEAVLHGGTPIGYPMGSEEMNSCTSWSGAPYVSGVPDPQSHGPSLSFTPSHAVNHGAGPVGTAHPGNYSSRSDRHVGFCLSPDQIGPAGPSSAGTGGGAIPVPTAVASSLNPVADGGPAAPASSNSVWTPRLRDPKTIIINNNIHNSSSSAMNQSLNNNPTQMNGTEWNAAVLHPSSRRHPLLEKGVISSLEGPEGSHQVIGGTAMASTNSEWLDLEDDEQPFPTSGRAAVGVGTNAGPPHETSCSSHSTLFSASQRTAAYTAPPLALEEVELFTAVDHSLHAFRLSYQGTSGGSGTNSTSNATNTTNRDEKSRRNSNISASPLLSPATPSSLKTSAMETQRAFHEVLTAAGINPAVASTIFCEAVPLSAPEVLLKPSETYVVVHLHRATAPPECLAPWESDPRGTSAAAPSSSRPAHPNTHPVVSTTSSNGGRPATSSNRTTPLARGNSLAGAPYCLPLTTPRGTAGTVSSPTSPRTQLPAWVATAAEVLTPRGLAGAFSSDMGKPLFRFADAVPHPPTASGRFYDGGNTSTCTSGRGGGAEVRPCTTAITTTTTSGSFTVPTPLKPSITRDSGGSEQLEEGAGGLVERIDSAAVKKAAPGSALAVEPPTTFVKTSESPIGPSSGGRSPAQAEDEEHELSAQHRSPLVLVPPLPVTATNTQLVQRDPHHYHFSLHILTGVKAHPFLCTVAVVLAQQLESALQRSTWLRQQLFVPSYPIVAGDVLNATAVSGPPQPPTPRTPLPSPPAGKRRVGTPSPRLVPPSPGTLGIGLRRVSSGSQEDMAAYGANGVLYGCGSTSWGARVGQLTHHNLAKKSKRHTSKQRGGDTGYDYLAPSSSSALWRVLSISDNRQSWTNYPHGGYSCVTTSWTPRPLLSATSHLNPYSNSSHHSITPPHNSSNPNAVMESPRRSGAGGYGTFWSQSIHLGAHLLLHQQALPSSPQPVPPPSQPHGSSSRSGRGSGALLSRPGSVTNTPRPLVLGSPHFVSGGPPPSLVSKLLQMCGADSGNSVPVPPAQSSSYYNHGSPRNGIAGFSPITSSTNGNASSNLYASNTTNLRPIAQTATAVVPGAASTTANPRRLSLGWSGLEQLAGSYPNTATTVTTPSSSPQLSRVQNDPPLQTRAREGCRTPRAALDARKRDRESSTPLSPSPSTVLLEGGTEVLPLRSDTDSLSRSASNSSHLQDEIWMTANRLQRLQQCAPEATEILPWLFVGGESAAKDEAQLLRKGMTAVVNTVAFDLPCYFEDSFHYQSLYLQDSPDEPIFPLIPLVNHFIERERHRNGKVFIHCHQGVSRSCSFVIAYVMWCNGWCYDRAYDFVRARRTICSPNPGFYATLQVWEQQLRHGPPTRSCAFALAPFDPPHGVPRSFRLAIEMNSAAWDEEAPHQHSNDAFLRSKQLQRVRCGDECWLDPRLTYGVLLYDPRSQTYHSYLLIRESDRTSSEENLGSIEAAPELSLRWETFLAFSFYAKSTPTETLNDNAEAIRFEPAQWNGLWEDTPSGVPLERYVQLLQSPSNEGPSSAPSGTTRLLYSSADLVRVLQKHFYRLQDTSFTAVQLASSSTNQTPAEQQRSDARDAHTEPFSVSDGELAAVWPSTQFHTHTPDPRWDSILLQGGGVAARVRSYEKAAAAAATRACDAARAQNRERKRASLERSATTKGGGGMADERIEGEAWFGTTNTEHTGLSVERKNTDVGDLTLLDQRGECRGVRENKTLPRAPHPHAAQSARQEDKTSRLSRAGNTDPPPTAAAAYHRSAVALGYPHCHSRNAVQEGTTLCSANTVTRPSNPNEDPLCGEALDHEYILESGDREEEMLDAEDMDVTVLPFPFAEPLGEDFYGLTDLNSSGCYSIFVPGSDPQWYVWLGSGCGLSADAALDAFHQNCNAALCGSARSAAAQHPLLVLEGQEPDELVLALD